MEGSVERDSSVTESSSAWARLAIPEVETELLEFANYINTSDNSTLGYQWLEKYFKSKKILKLPSAISKTLVSSHQKSAIKSVMKPKDSLLKKRLEAVLPKGKAVWINHTSTCPISCNPLHASLPGDQPEETWLEKHFLLVSLKCPDGGVVPVYGLEVLVYTTEHLTTMFVSKADSTGFMYRMPWDAWALSPMKAIASTFLRLLADTRQRKDKRLVMSLFARSQHTYIFPGSGENSKKNILNDAELIKWWARVMDVVMDLDGPEIEDEIASSRPKEATPTSAQVYLRIPGYSARETRPFVPKDIKETSSFRTVSLAKDPLQLLAPRPDLPARCMIPHFYDDPKTRFAEELNGYDKVKEDGNWSSVSSLDMFWDLMQYRQECGAGRLVGFLWGVFNPNGLVEKRESTSKTAATVPLQSVSSTLRQTATNENPGWYEPPELVTGEVVLLDSKYHDAQDKLAAGDFLDQIAAMESVKRWVEVVCDLTGVERFGYLVEGMLLAPPNDSETLRTRTHMCDDDGPEAKQVESCKKRTWPGVADKQGDPKPGNERTSIASTDDQSVSKERDDTLKLSDSNRKAKQPSSVNLLSGGMVRKKPKLG